jgi:hypothetical protein
MSFPQTKSLVPVLSQLCPQQYVTGACPEPAVSSPRCPTRNQLGHVYKEIQRFGLSYFDVSRADSNGGILGSHIGVAEGQVF